jgi:hypothetical protein
MSETEHFAAVVRRALPHLQEKTVSHYATGTKFEHKCRDDLEANGYDVIRAAGSKGSTKVDLAAFKPGQLLLIQCKSDGVLPPAEWDRIFEVAGWIGGAIPLLAANGIRGRGITYIRLLGAKRPGLHMKNQPCEVFHLDHLAAASPPSAALAGDHPHPRGSGYPRPSQGFVEPLRSDVLPITGQA